MSPHFGDNSVKVIRLGLTYLKENAKICLASFSNEEIAISACLMVGRWTSKSKTTVSRSVCRFIFFHLASFFSLSVAESDFHTNTTDSFELFGRGRRAGEVLVDGVGFELFFELTWNDSIPLF